MWQSNRDILLCVFLRVDPRALWSAVPAVCKAWLATRERPAIRAALFHRAHPHLAQPTLLGASLAFEACRQFNALRHAFRAECIQGFAEARAAAPLGASRWHVSLVDTLTRNPVGWRALRRRWQDDPLKACLWMTTFIKQLRAARTQRRPLDIAAGDDRSDGVWCLFNLVVFTLNAALQTHQAVAARPEQCMVCVREPSNPLDITEYMWKCYEISRVFIRNVCETCLRQATMAWEQQNTSRIVAFNFCGSTTVAAVVLPMYREDWYFLSSAQIQTPFILTVTPEDVTWPECVSEIERTPTPHKEEAAPITGVTPLPM